MSVDPSGHPVDSSQCPVDSSGFSLAYWTSTGILQDIWGSVKYSATPSSKRTMECVDTCFNSIAPMWVHVVLTYDVSTVLSPDY